ncbi:hypothetical protein GIB67_035038 [Kingdonia uniflora]|uniref:Uncharacterized protein n=1 Tax=Kingdonia uniflora TaxID=39325 RepID=A0A7J7L1M4_9MAGN|nr:hypothetical protein GIB67_035038 [Kingdonia uniflora]
MQYRTTLQRNSIASQLLMWLVLSEQRVGSKYDIVLWVTMSTMMHIGGMFHMVHSCRILRGVKTLTSQTLMLTSEVTFSHVEFPTAYFSTQETQIPPPRLSDYPGWIMELGLLYGTTWHTIPSIASTSTIDIPAGYDFFTMIGGMRKLTLDRTLDLEARHLYDESRITHLIADLRSTDGRLSQLNDYLDREGIVVDWEDDEGEAGTSQAGTSQGRGLRGRGSRGRTFEGGCCVPYPMNFEAILDVFIDSSSKEEEEDDIEQSSTDYSDDDVIDEIKLEILRNQAELKNLKMQNLQEFVSVRLSGIKL